VGNSLSFNGSSQYLSNGGSASNNQKTFTFACWFKLPADENGSFLFSSNVAETNFAYFSISNNGSGLASLQFLSQTGGSTVAQSVTSNFTTDTNWHHVCFAVDTTQATSTNRVIIYLDGTVASTTTYTAPPQNTNLSINNTSLVTIGDQAGSLFFSGNLTEMYFIDGQQLSPSSFITGTPGIPKTFSGSYTGVWDWYLNFRNGASTTTLGNDSSGEGNNWTLNSMATSNQTLVYPGYPDYVDAFTGQWLEPLRQRIITWQQPIAETILFTQTLSPHSLIFNGSTQYLSNGGNASNNQQKFTFVCWFKLGNINENGVFLYSSASAINTNNSTLFQIDNDGAGQGNIVLDAMVAGGFTNGCFLQTVDFSTDFNWHHVCFSVDTTQSNAANRAIVYLDGVQLSNFSYTAPPQNATLSINNTVVATVGQGNGFLFNGKLTEMYFIDGQQLSPTSFITGTPGIPKTYSGSYTGVWDWYLNFRNGTSTTTLGYDSSGENNNWTLNSMTTANQSLDYPGYVDFIDALMGQWGTPIWNRRLPTFIDNAIPIALSTFSVTLSGWHKPLNEPVRIKPSLPTNEQQFLAYTAGLPNLGVSLSGWYGPFTDPVRVKPGLPTAEQQPLTYTAGLPNYQVNLIGWQTPFSDPVRWKPSVIWQQPLAETLGFTTVIVPPLSWYASLTDPIRLKPGLQTALQQPIAQTFSQPNYVVPALSFWQPLAEPIRVRLQNYGDLRTSLAYTPPPLVNWWFTNLGDPTRVRLGLLPGEQQFLALAPGLVLTQNITATMVAIEINSDVASAGIDVYSLLPTLSFLPTARVSIKEIPAVGRR
jgi:Concanavalin A-like lectin/glucanases superfamily